jgi:SAM-dependent methyltransferase
MSDWTAGYVAELDYTYGYYPELNPLRIRPAFVQAGLVPPRIETACELGFGQGVSVNIHAAAGGARWYGTDFNPAQSAFAQELALVSAVDARLYDEAFADFARRSDLPDFDFIGLHGIWSWISEENRVLIVDFLRRKLKVGGVLYISYNTQPGWAGFAPMRHLLSAHADIMGAAGTGIVNRVNGAIDFAEKLLAANPAYARINPRIADRMKKLKEQNRHYLAHEYFNRDWQPVHFSEMTQCLAEAKLSFAGSAHVLDHIDSINLTGTQQALLKEIPDETFRETVRDFIVNQQFRRDYWVKGARRFSALKRNEMQQIQQFVLVTSRPDVALKISGIIGEAALDETIYGPLLDVLADHKPRSPGQLLQLLKGKSISFGQILQATQLLSAAGHLVPAQDEAGIANARKHTDKLNANLFDRARDNGDISYLASPVTGGGISVGRFQQLFLLARAQGAKLPADWAEAVWQILDAQGQKLVKEGKTLMVKEDNLAELTRLAQGFAEKKLPILRELQVV